MSYAADFRERQRATWHLARWWVAMGLAGFVLLFVLYYFIEVDEFSAWYVFGFLMATMGIVKATFIVKEHYRCPACEQTVWDDEGVDLDPKACPHCGAQLRSARVERAS